mmetsp:Transcript_8536/g.12448  ORF Transcript_8536/g.12448 Transcript_8536/m.12448 type:complete len:136 (-) Transcript_8536:199-606(-)|eukprot:CAMPEP_0206498246 /NCGR_PEP_ID=MMETSP0324_2-20121206/50833_1 /ASSEMBLY_ACC=CAM_ASM_000836 /TAXON_ID=2866 /ORGANISM="Crypthecodinium cohnii, Strain Seligo" /LENGTH=135 /DNA_ID=CAMNT_0053984303 /DNA_START=1 /DNA_END=408 /DNA_ORIENTATION=+
MEAPPASSGNQDAAIATAQAARSCVKAAGMRLGREPSYTAQPPQGLPRLVPDEPPNSEAIVPDEICGGAADELQHLTKESLLLLIEAARREQISNWEVHRAFPRRAPCLNRFDGFDRQDLLARTKDILPPATVED